MAGKTKNIGEISEFYSFVYILGNRCLQMVDGNLKPIDKTLEFLKVKRKEFTSIVGDKTYDRSNEYDLASCSSEIIIHQAPQDNTPGKVIQLPRKLIGEKADELLVLMKESSGAIDDDDPCLTSLKDLLLTKHISAKAQDKSDFSGTVISESSPGAHSLGFSVKSQMGSPSSLINANKEQSAFKCSIVKNDGSALSDDDITEMLSWTAKNKQLISKIFAEGYDLRFDSLKGEALEYNLTMIDSFGPEIIGALLIERFRLTNASTRINKIIAELAKDEIACKHPAITKLGHKPEERINKLNFKLKNILLGFTTGATAGTKWDGIDQANGGFIIVTRDGQVVCLELFTRNAIGQYLLNNTYFENPSQRRHGHGFIYREDDKAYIDLQLQVRFKD